MSAIQTWRRAANERLSLCTYANEWQPCANGIVVLGLSLFCCELNVWWYFCPRIDNVIAFWMRTKTVFKKFFFCLFFVLISAVVDLMNIYFLTVLEGNEENYECARLRPWVFWVFLHKTALRLARNKKLNALFQP